MQMVARQSHVQIAACIHDLQLEEHERVPTLAYFEPVPNSCFWNNLILVSGFRIDLQPGISNSHFLKFGLADTAPLCVDAAAQIHNIQHHPGISPAE